MRYAKAVAAVVLAAALQVAATACKNDCQTSVQSNGPGNQVNSHCDR